MSKDIDFDELDKAVSSLMGSVPKNGTDETPQQKTLTIAGTLKPDEEPAHAKLNEVAKKIGSEAIVTDTELTLDTHDIAEPAIKEVSLGQSAVMQPPEVQKPAQPAAPRPASGRFMDVVHPSSDMRSTEVPQNQVSALPPQAAPSVVMQPPTTSQPMAEVPLTPFLPDAKVEKRPLGVSPVPTPLSVESASPMMQSDNETSRESQSSTTLSLDPMAQPEQVTTGDQPVLDASSFEEPAPSVTPEIIAIESAETAPEQMVPTSAAVASVESGDTERLTTGQPADAPGAIYDAANQPQPLSHPQKKKSGWGVVAIIVLIIVLAAVLGAAAYFILGLGV